MTFLNPLALLWLGSVPVLVWLWRMTSSQRQIRIPSLVPFERLLRRPPTYRAHLIVNALFWLQLLALLGLTLAMSQPALAPSRSKIVLGLLDTSASMGAAEGRGASAFDAAKQALLAQIARKAPGTQVLVMTTAPVGALSQQPMSDGTALSNAVQALRASHLGGNLSTAARIGRALLGADPDETWVVTDEPPPAPPVDDRVRWIAVGKPLSNVALVGLDALGPLCRVSDARVMATVQNFSNESARVTVAARQGARSLAHVSAEMAPRARQAFSLTLPDDTEGWVEMVLTGEPDRLSIDNHTWIALHRRARLPIVVRSSTPSLTDALTTWLGACEALTWTAESSAPHGAALLITDQEALASTATASLVFPASAHAAPTPAYWMARSDHPVGSYLAPIEVVAAALNVSSSDHASSAPVVSALVHGQRVPIVVADERDGRRRISMRFDPSSSGTSTAPLLVFFNSLRWLMGEPNATATGEPMTITGFAPGSVQVRRPDGATEVVDAEGGAIRYDATTLSGLYRLSQRGADVVAAVNFFDPLESNLIDRVSTWSASTEPQAASGARRPATRPLAGVIMLALLLLMLIEWRIYSAKGRITPARRSL